MRETLILASAYFLGAIPFAWLAARVGGGKDIRHAGSGNVGATNVLRSAGVQRAVVALALDAGKGAAAVWLARRAALDDPSSGDPWVALAGFMAVVGHVLPIWFSFRGKGVATASGVFAVLAPRSWLVAAVVFVVIVWTTRYVSLGALLGALTLAVVALASEPRAVAAVAVASAALVGIRHKSNITRLRAGTEWRLGS
jgi:acyl phosphate:glycerol-3-phosphate acyltransferase